jgi:6-pyruvoyltetrahydropterin/6-carboxytetrahydropterin synthase
MLITRRIDFSASHLCANPAWSPERNREVYGAAAHAAGHGHNYVVEVTIEGRPNPVTGMIFDLKELKDVLNREVVEPMDHRFLNYEVPPFDRVVPTTENLAIEIWSRVEPALQQRGVRLHGIRVYETEDLYVDYFGSMPAPGDRP